MSNVPAAARRQVEAANAEVALLRAGQHPTQIGGAAPAPAGEPPPNLPNVGAQIPADARPVDLTAPRQPAPISFQPDVPRFQTPQQAPRQPQAPAPQPNNAPPPDAVGMQPVDHEHRFKVLQGKYTAETRRNAQEIQQLREQNSLLINRLAAGPAPTAAPAPPPVQLTLEQRAANVGISKAEIAEYGPELIEMMIRTASNIAASQVAPLANSQRQLQGAVNQTVQNIQKTARELVYEALAAQINDWQTVNTSQEFLDWLDEHDIFSGQTRKAGLLRAFESNDATRVVGIFRAFLEEDERARSTARTPRVDPATLIAPGQPLGGGAPAPTDGNQSRRIWLESEVGDFWALVRKGVYRHKPDEKTAIEAEINRAAAEGRIRPTHNDAGISNAR